ncbi:hypothetical protein AWN76_012135 [Rhodothermaceae bacterium RA]|nr:hypothetical protein AWN76_012135 [Rhodothermaceae bacterium RA]
MSFNLRQIRKRSAPVVWLLTGLFLLFPVGRHALAGIVLCFEGDGRVEIETARLDDCGSDFWSMVTEIHKEHAALQAGTTPEEICEDCVDVPLFVSFSDAQAFFPVKAAAVPAVALPVAALLPAQPRPSVAMWPAHPASHDPSSLFSLSTVVLLI